MKRAFQVRAGTGEIEKALADPALRSLSLDFEGAADPETYASMVGWLARLPWTDLEMLEATSAAAPFGDHVALGFATAGLPSTLTSLAIRGCALRTVGVVHLAPGLPSSLVSLSLRDNRLDAEVVAALLRTLPASLKALDLAGNSLGDGGAAALVAASSLEKLAELDVSRNALSVAAVKALTDRFGTRVRLDTAPP